MGILYKEIIRNKKFSIIKGLFLIILFTLVTFLATNSVDYSLRYNIRLDIILLIDVFLSAIMFKIIYEIAYSNRLSYTYKLIDTELIFERMIGNNRRVILSVDARNIEAILQLKEGKNFKDIDRTYKFLCRPCKNKTYCCIVNNKGKKIKFYFQPSDELMRKIENIMRKEP